jgi:hypothetical protein
MLNADGSECMIIGTGTYTVMHRVAADALGHLDVM